MTQSLSEMDISKMDITVPPAKSHSDVMFCLQS